MITVNKRKVERREVKERRKGRKESEEKGEQKGEGERKIKNEGKESGKKRDNTYRTQKDGINKIIDNNSNILQWKLEFDGRGEGGKIGIRKRHRYERKKGDSM